MEYSLLSLYQSILVPILSEWISDTDLCYLDTAVCSEKLRKDFLSHLGYCGVPGVTSGTHRYKYDWMKKRGIKLTSISVNSLVDLDSIPPELLISTNLKFCSILLSLDCIEYLEKLKIKTASLCLHSSCINDKLFKRALCLFPQLTKLDVSNCRFSEEASSIIADCHHLRSLQVSPALNPLSAMENFPVGSVSSWNCSVGSTMTYASCDLVQVVQSTDSSISLLDKHYWATSMRISCSDVVLNDCDAFCRLIKPLESLKVLRMDHSPQLMSFACCSCTSLVEFSCQWRMDGTDLKRLLQRNRRLQSLNLIKVKAVDAVVVDLIAESCPDLNKLVIDEFDASESSLNNLIEQCIQLQHVSLSNCETLQLILCTHVKNNAMLYISKRHTQHSVLFNTVRLGRQAFIWNRLLETSELLNIIGNNPTVQSISFQCVGNLTSAVLAGLVRMCPSLSEVSIAVDDQYLLSVNDLLVLKDCKQLTALTVQGMKMITSDLLRELLSSTPNLNKLQLDYCSNLCSDVLLIVSQCCPMIRRVSVRSAAVCDSDVRTLLACCPRLDHLCLYGCQSLTPALLDCLRSRRMRYLNVSGVFNGKTLEAFLQSGFDPLCNLFCG